MKTKSEIRNFAKKARDGFPADYIAEKSGEVIQNLLSHYPEIKEKTVMSYKSIRGEINLDNLENHISSKVFYPVIENGIVVAKSENFQIGAFGIYEPTCGEIEKEKIDICLIPGVAFSKNMQRIGFGKGFYDVFLQNFKGIKIGITYENLMVETIDPDKFDIPMDIIITEKNIYGNIHKKGQA
ncbi:MAG: 5-formyltetrahydrofolate cyclo-ligase [Bacillota bacterium]